MHEITTIVLNLFIKQIKLENNIGFILSMHHLAFIVHGVTKSKRHTCFTNATSNVRFLYACFFYLFCKCNFKCIILIEKNFKCIILIKKDFKYIMYVVSVTCYVNETSNAHVSGSPSNDLQLV